MVQTNIKSFHSGDTTEFYVSSSDFNINEYDCEVVFSNIDNSYRFKSFKKENDKFIYVLDELETEKIKSDFYRLYCVFIGNNKKKTIKSSNFEVKENVMKDNADALTQNQRYLKAITDKINDRIRDDYDSYTIGGRSINKISIERLIDLQKRYQELVDYEKAKENGNNEENKIIIYYSGRFK